MRKQDLIRLHALLLQMRRTLEANGLATAKEFATYDSLGVTPVHVYKDRRAHQQAVFTLGEALSHAAVSHAGPAAELRNTLHFFAAKTRAL
ncbi:MAG TPA: UPF0058 family protein [Candidatus Thermoplasmatota archaeon]|nr:UPF0058 family protein [Candidatus Thermoplasmatota archaeon]